MTTATRRRGYWFSLNGLVLGPLVLGLWTTTVQAECTNPALFQQLSQISIHSTDSRLTQHRDRDLIHECKKEMWQRQHEEVQNILSELRVRETVLPDDPHSHDRIHHHDQSTDPNVRFEAVGNVFPPQPKSMENIRTEQSVALMGRAAIAQENANTLTLQSPDVQIALGDRYVHVGQELLGMKGQRNNHQVRHTFFSHTNNMTVEVLVDQDSVITIHPIPPVIYQPPLTETEVAEAIQIARRTLIAEGNTQVAELEGNTILALPTDGNSAFFDHRIGYVSFHHNVDVGPEYVAWVDLTDQVVVESRED